MLHGRPKCIITFAEEFIGNEMFFGVLAQEVPWKDAITGAKEFKVHDFLHFAHCYQFSEAYVISLIDFNAPLKTNILTQAIFTAYYDLGWDTLAKAVTYRLLGVRPEYLDKISQNGRTVFKELL
jgi:hypothetical protein